MFSRGTGKAGDTSYVVRVVRKKSYWAMGFSSVPQLGVLVVKQSEQGRRELVNPCVKVNIIKYKVSLGYDLVVHTLATHSDAPCRTH